MSRGDPEAYTERNRVALINTGDAYFQRMEALIDGARQAVHLQVYILADDETGARVGNALVRAARRGVVVYLLVDGYASRDLPKALVEELRTAGGHVAWFEPIWRSRHFYVGRRMHHKVLVVDHRFGLVSGRNIADRYMDRPGEPAWYDIAVDVEGEVVADLERLCCQLWNARPERVRTGRAIPPTTAEVEAMFKDWPAHARCAVRVRFNDWLRHRSEITRSYAAMFQAARSEVWLISSYFVPGRFFKRMLSRAVRRGVRVVLVTSGHSDVLIAKPAERWLYAWLLRRGVEVYEYQGPVMHAKVAARDDEWCTAGSFNVNDLSTYTTLEVNLDVNDRKVGKQLGQVVDGIALHECRRITAEEEGHVGPLRKLGRWLAYQALRISHTLVTSYYHRER